MKYFKSYLLIVAFWLTILILPCSSFGFQNEPDAFRGIKWGTNINKLSDMYIVESISQHEKLYKRKNDKMKIGNAEIDAISYIFYKKRFSSSFIEFKLSSNFRQLKSTFFQLYGEPYRPKQFLERYIWTGTEIIIAIDYNDISKEGKIVYMYKPINDEQEKDQKEASKKGADDL